MILIVSRSTGMSSTVSEIFMTMGYVTECVSPERAATVLSFRHHGVLVLGRRACADSAEFVAELRAVRGPVPIFSVRDDLSADAYRYFDGVYPNSVYSAGIVSDLIRLANKRGQAPIGEYRTGALRAEVGRREVTLGGVPLGLTKTESGILRYLICMDPTAVRARDVLSHAFKSARMPTEAGVRTHISAINRKAQAVCGRPLIASEGGYRLALGEMATV